MFVQTFRVLFQGRQTFICQGPLKYIHVSFGELPELVILNITVVSLCSLRVRGGGAVCAGVINSVIFSLCSVRVN